MDDTMIDPDEVLAGMDAPQGFARKKVQSVAQANRIIPVLQATITEQADIINQTQEWLTKYAPEMMPAYAVLLGEAYRKHATLKPTEQEENKL